MSADVQSPEPITEASTRPGSPAAPPLPPPVIGSSVTTRSVPRHGLRSEADEPPMGGGRQLWRCSGPVRLAVVLVMVVVGLALPAAAVISLLTGVTGFGDRPVPALAVIYGVAGVVVVFGWRLGLHPRLVLDGDRLTVANPFRRHSLDLAEVTVLAPGGDGLRVATAAEEVEVWCVQKSDRTAAAGRRTRADDICAAIWSAWDAVNPVQTGPDQPARIRFARPEDDELLAVLVGAVRGADLAGQPATAARLRQQLRSTLTDRSRQTMIAEIDGRPVGWAHFGPGTLHELAVVPDQRRQGIGTSMLTATEAALFADRATSQASVRLSRQDLTGRCFLLGRGWTAPSDRTPAGSATITMTRANPHRPRRGR